MSYLAKIKKKNVFQNIALCKFGHRKRGISKPITAKSFKHGQRYNHLERALKPLRALILFFVRV